MVDHGLRARQGRAARCFFACFGALATLAACGGEASPSAATTTTTVTFPLSTSSSTSISTSNAVPTEEAAVRSAYEVASRAFIDAAAVPDPNFPALAATHTGPMLIQRRDVLLGLKADGRVIRYPQPSKYLVVVRSVDLQGDVAKVAFCAVDDGERVQVSTGEVLARGVSTVTGTAALQRQDGRWKLAEQKFDSRQQEVASCNAGA